MPRGSQRKCKLSRALPCTVSGCPQRFLSVHSCTYHIRSCHPLVADTAAKSRTEQLPGSPSPPPLDHEDFQPYLPTPTNNQADGDNIPQPPTSTLSKTALRTYHPFLNGKYIIHLSPSNAVLKLLALPCSILGQNLPPNTPPPPRTTATQDDWSPYEDAVQFQVADFAFRSATLSATNINVMLETWALSLMKHNENGPFQNHKDLYNTIDSTNLGDAPWKCLETSIEEVPEDAPIWKKTQYEVWYRDPDAVIRNMLDDPSFNGEFDTTPYIQLDKDGNRRWSDFMSGNFAWRHCVNFLLPLVDDYHSSFFKDQIYQDHPEAEGAMYVPIILGSDKTTVSVATGDVEYHPLYLSIGNVHNSVRRAHRNAVIPIGFLAIPKGM